MWFRIENYLKRRSWKQKIGRWTFLFTWLSFIFVYCVGKLMVLVMNYRSLRHSYCCFSCFPIYDYCRLLLMVPTPTLITLIRCSQHRCCRVIMLLLFSLLTMIMSLFGLSPRTFLCVRVRAWQGIRRWRIGGDLCWPGGRMVAGGEGGRRVFSTGTCACILLLYSFFLLFTVYSLRCPPFLLYFSVRFSIRF